MHEAQPTVKIMYPSRVYVDLLRPQVDDIYIEDIAWSLSLQCRFGGCCGEFYSVAQHSIWCCDHGDPKYAFDRLMHDSHEAYVQDLVSGMKKSMGTPYAFIDRLWASAVEMRFGHDTQAGDVKLSDAMALATERRDLDLDDGSLVNWPFIRNVAPHPERIRPLPAGAAYLLFLERFKKHYRSRHGVDATFRFYTSGGKQATP